MHGFILDIVPKGRSVFNTHLFANQPTSVRVFESSTDGNHPWSSQL